MSRGSDLTYASVTELHYNDLRFLITDSPANDNIQSFIQVCFISNDEN